ncbi:MAG: hypothetical protein JNN11_01745 [Candidatus Doudnabacteria bacterium]|nr:hypothetical protein [Candidatus Doudnabacteria bacterium]
MTTQEVAEQIIKYINEGKNTQAQEELYADDVVNVEQDGQVVVGKLPVMEKTKAVMASVEQFFGGGVSKAYVAKDSFLLEISMDVKFKGQDRVSVKEYGFYEVKDGKVVKETFFMKEM